MIYRPGDTRPFEFIIPFNKESIKYAYLSFKQDEVTVLTVDDQSNLELIQGTSPNTCYLKAVLSQEEGLQLTNYPRCLVQINLIIDDSAKNRLVSKPIKFNVRDQFYREIIDDRGESNE